MFPISRFRDKGQIILALLLLLAISAYSIRFGFLGANADWMNQHVVFPDYFRKLFYQTGDLFPNYAPNLGAGQNLYNFSYYGFLNPVLLVSYLLPFVEMPVYIMAVSLISLAAACLLFYRWLKDKGFSGFISVSASMIFLLAAPMFYQTYKQIMFVNYMPFLCLALIGVDRYFKAGKKGLLTVSVFLMIMSSFYFSVSGLFAICLYWLSVYMSREEKLEFRDLFRSGALFLIPIFTAVLMAGVLLIPTLASLLESHRGSQTAIGLFSLLLPQFKLLRYTYSPYGIGLPSIVITVLLAGLFYKKPSERILSYGMLLITVLPIFLFLMNGGLYINDKALIPFLPILCYLIALFFHKLETKDEPAHRNLLLVFLATAALTLTGMGQTIYWAAVFADATVMLLLYFVYRKHPTIKLLILPVIAFSLIAVFAVQNPGKLVGRHIWREVSDPDIAAVMREVSRDDPSYYRMDSFLNKDNSLNRVETGNQYLTSFYSSSYQKDYFDFRNNIFQLERPYRNYMMQSASQDPLFLTFMGVKYVRSASAPVGYELFREQGDVKIYRNESVFPLGYMTDKLISGKNLNKYGFPYRQELLLHYAAVDDAAAVEKYPAEAADFQSAVKPAETVFPNTEGKHFSLTSRNGVYRIVADRETTGRLLLLAPAPEDEVLFLEMRVKNLTPLQDVSMKIQNEQNRLSAVVRPYYNKNTVFHYAVSVKKGDTELPVLFSTGKFELSSVRSFTLSASELTAAGRKGGVFEVSATDTKGDVITGSVNAPEDGWFVTTIPYDPNFRIALDGKAIRYEKVNTAFVGFPITKGFHHIAFRYVSPGFNTGAAASIIGFLIFGIVLFTDRTGDPRRRF